MGITVKNKKEQKKWQVTYIAPLQPLTLAAFLPWGSSMGAGRIRLAGANVVNANNNVCCFFRN